MKRNLYFIFAHDKSTEFLFVFKDKFTERFYTIIPSEISVEKCLEFMVVSY